MTSRLLALFAIALLVSACNNGEQKQAATTGKSLSGGTFVQLFEWRWPDVATECENFLGPAGYAAVQISPPNEHVDGPAWWTRYQPVSYKLESRGGTRTEFADMVRRCKSAGVDIYADAVINHMATIGNGVGVAGSSYSEFSYPVPYTFDDFHHCGRYDDDVIRNYQDLWEVQNCSLNRLADLDTGKLAVQKKIATYLDDLLSLGVAGFRLDAAKHMSPEDIQEILRLVDDDPVIYQEVIDRGGEPVSASAYLGNGRVTEFKFPMLMVEAFEQGDLAALTGFESQPGFLPADEAIVFVDNHDLQRGHAGAAEIVNYKDGARYDLAIAFMLAYPYGYPMVMSSYAFDDPDQGPPAFSPSDVENGCGKAWICEHRRNVIANMVGFRKQTAGTRVTNWQLIGDSVLSFGRGDKGHIIINNGEQAVHATTRTSMPPGQYCDVISGDRSEDGCTGLSVRVDDNGTTDVTIAALSTIAIHRKSMVEAKSKAVSTRKIEIVVRVPEDTPTVFLTGNVDALGPWDPHLLAMTGDGRQRSATLDVPDGQSLEYKFTLGDWSRAALDSDGVALANYTLDVEKDQAVSQEIAAFSPDTATYMADWRNSGVLGALVYWPDVASEFLSETHHVEIWLPPGYDDDPSRSYKVIYVHDGQNLFDPRMTEYDIDWGVDEAMLRGVESGKFEAAIVVGIWNTPRRLHEYSPWDEAPQFARFMIEELMPRVNAEFRTLEGPENTFTMGSSMGGLLSFYLVKEHPNVFGACGCLSSHFSLSDVFLATALGKDPATADATPYLLRDIANGYSAPTGGRFLFDYGTRGLDAEYGHPHAVLRDWLLKNGLQEGRDFVIRVYDGADHNNASWRARVDDQLVWLLAGE